MLSRKDPGSALFLSQRSVPPSTTSLKTSIPITQVLVNFMQFLELLLCWDVNSASRWCFPHYIFFFSLFLFIRLICLNVFFSLSDHHILGEDHICFLELKPV